MELDRAIDLNAPLSTARLALEPRTVAHAEPLYAALQDEAIYTWISNEPPFSAQLLRSIWGPLERRLSPQNDEAWLNWAVRRVSDGAYVGQIDASVNEEGVATNVGYVFFPAFWGQGLATEAVRAVVGHLASRGVGRMWARVTAGNLASERVLVRVGFVRTRIIPGNEVIRGVVHDDVEYVWEAGPDKTMNPVIGGAGS